MKEYRLQLFVLLIACILFPTTAHAHNLVAMLEAGLFLFAVAAVAAAFAKRFAVRRIFKLSEYPRKKSFLGIAVIEVLILVFAFPLSFYLTESRHTFVLLFAATLVYALVSIFPNFVFLRRLLRRKGTGQSDRALLVYSFCAGLVFPAIMWVFVSTFLGGLYELLGG